MKKISGLLIFLAGSLWGCMGIFVKLMAEFGFSTVQTSSLRLVSASIMLLIYILITDKSILKIKIRDLAFPVAMGIFSLLLMSLLYFTTITLTSMSVAAILLYTAPVLVMIMSVVFLKEKLNVKKIIALIFAVTGCVLVAGIGDAKITAVGLITGLLSALAYALYSILGTFALKKLRPFTVTFYAFLAAAVGSLFVANPITIFSTLFEKDAAYRILMVFVTGLVSAVAPYVLYTFGLKYTEASKASIIACVEPLVATLLGVFIYGESLNVFHILGIVSILFAILILNNFGIKPNAKLKN